MSTGGGQVENACFETSSEDSGRLFQREGAHELKALAPVLVLILGMGRVIPLFDLSERDGREMAIKERM